MQLPLIEGVEPPVGYHDDLERVYTPAPLAELACAAIALTCGTAPRRILEAHVGGGAWVTAARATWPEAELGVGDMDPRAPGFRLGASEVYRGRLEDHMEEWTEWRPDWFLGNPPFSVALDQLADIAQLLPRARVGWLLPLDLYSTGPWARFLTSHPPRYIRPITSRVWSCVRGVAVWEWWNIGVPEHWPTNVVPLEYSRTNRPR